MINNVKFGADPEFFLTDGKKFIPSIGLIGGTKEEPIDIGKGVKLQEDNVMVEFNVNPTTSHEEMWHDIQHAIKTTEEKTGHMASILPSAKFHKKYLEDPQAQHIGCSPDYNVWTESKNKTPDIKDSQYRYAGGHLHIGFECEPENFYIIAFSIVKRLDFLLLPEFVGTDAASKRRNQVYGDPGRFRIKPYGVEYRSLSNNWIKDKESVKKVLDIAKIAVNTLDDLSLTYQANFAFNRRMSLSDTIKYVKSDRRREQWLSEVL